MPYEVKKIGNSPKPWKIIEKATGKVVGESDAKDKADRSVGYRIAGETKQSGRTQGNRGFG